MTSILPRISAEFETLDELTMRGRVFPASQRGPAMIMSPGVCTRAARWLVLASCANLTGLWVV